MPSLRGHGALRVPDVSDQAPLMKAADGSAISHVVETVTEEHSAGIGSAKCEGEGASEADKPKY
jgi:hypothetical protein